MSFAQFAIAYLWWQLPLVGLSALFSADLEDLFRRWTILNVGSVFIIGTFWTFTELVINWKDFA